MEPGAWKLIPMYQATSSQDLKFRITASGPCATPGNVVFPCGGGGDVTVDADGGLGMLKVIGQPWEHVQYYGGFGPGKLTLRLPDGQVMTSKRTGWAFQGGARAVILPDTVVSPAVALDLGYWFHRYAFDEVRPAATAAAGQISQRLDIQQLQVALETSHRFEFQDPKMALEPYGGVKWLRSQSSLTDNQLGGQVAGAQDTITPFVGLQVPVFERETLFAEASFVNGIQYAAGLHVRFK
ncbi:MAG: autotransporter domain-containing protein [Elusimicrobia bacterium]|nr:autotransporter domain-containing protein [Elusimicrobiota bacterium]